MAANKADINVPVARLPLIPAVSWKARRGSGRKMRQTIPRSAHARWSPTPERDVLALLAASNEGRLKRFVAIRYGRMLASPFAFYRGTPGVMAYDLAHMPSSSAIVQLCGDCHIGNFGLFAAPDRKQVFDLNDFDETLPGPFEWDVKRMVTSIVIAARCAGLKRKKARRAVRRALRAYRRKMNRFAAKSYLETWYGRTDAELVLRVFQEKHRKKISAELAKARDKDRLTAFDKLTEVVDGERRIVHDPPLLIRMDKSEEQFRKNLRELFTAYFDSLEDSRKRLVSRYRFADVAHKVVGVGSVGTLSFITLWLGLDEDDPLFIQVKEARPSLLEPYLGRSEYDHPGQRVISGQRLMQAAHDIFLGFGQFEGRTFFIRQLYDMKGSIDLATIRGSYLARYAELCADVLARAHARTGDAAQIAGYLGKGKKFDKALTKFAFRYADQNDADWRAFGQAVVDGRLEVNESE